MEKAPKAPVPRPTPSPRLPGPSANAAPKPGVRRPGGAFGGRDLSRRPFERSAVDLLFETVTPRWGTGPISSYVATLVGRVPSRGVMLPTQAPYAAGC